MVMGQSKLLPSDVSIDYKINKSFEINNNNIIKLLPFTLKVIYICP